MISILVPVYNVERYLRKCLESIVSQTFRDIEIICINDGSTDGSGAILSEYKNIDPRIKVITQSNAGYGKAMNAGLEAAQGKYIGVVESDDFIDADMYEYLHKWIEENDADFIKTDYFRYRNGVDTLKAIYKDAVYDKVFAGANEKPIFLFDGGNIWTGLYRKSFLTNNNIRFLETPGASYQDISFNFKVFACATRILIKNKAFYHYRNDNDNASVKSRSKVYCVCDEFREIEGYLQNREDLAYVKNHWLSVYRFICYRWNYIRILDEFKPEFLLRWQEDIAKDVDRGLINRDDFPEGMRDIINEMISDKEAVFINEMSRIKERNYIKKSFLESISGDDPIYIYGAGNVGNSVMEIINKYNVFVDKVRSHNYHLLISV